VKGLSPLKKAPLIIEGVLDKVLELKEARVD